MAGSIHFGVSLVCPTLFYVGAQLFVKVGHAPRPVVPDPLSWARPLGFGEGSGYLRDGSPGTGLVPPVPSYL